MRACWQLGGLLLLAELAAGCAARQCQPNEPWYSSAPAQLACHEVEPGSLLPDVSLVSARESLPAAEPLPRYCNLIERDAQCLAATNAPQARLLEQEADAAAVQQGRPGQSGQTTQDVL